VLEIVFDWHAEDSYPKPSEECNRTNG